ncbi:MAG: thioether cross-link-forming SCIFF peptide maturase [Clostridia bacterium]|nr:thioether cross-link-forming SCIFF peptide maturase [Clostridia bacterium]
MIHVFSLNGYNIVLDVNSSTIHLVDDIMYDILNEFDDMPSMDSIAREFEDRYDISQLRECYDDINQLYQQGTLYSSDFDQSLLKKTNHKNNYVKALCMHVAHDCNLRCEYCFASKGDYKTDRGLMPKQVAFECIDFLAQNSGARKNIEVDFFGGEPLMNFDVVKDAVLYAKDKQEEYGKEFHFTITTNGLLLDECSIDFINEYMDNVVISIDGRKQVHDAIRYDREHRGSYDRILDNALNLVHKRGNKQYFIRGTFTANNLDFGEDVFHLADLGFDEISIEPVVGSGRPFDIKEEHLDVIKKEYEDLAIRYLDRIKRGKPFVFYHFNLDIFESPCIYKRITSCGAGYEYFAVSPKGELYPCHQFVGQPEFVMGDIYKGINNGQMSKLFRDNNVLNKTECRDCWAKYYCSGGCHANAYYSNGDISDPNRIACEMQKKRIECAIMIQAAKSTI